MDQILTSSNCYHCGDPFQGNEFVLDEKFFCCQGCLTVYEILSLNGLRTYYDLENHPGIRITQPKQESRFQYLEDEEIQKKLLSFNDGGMAMVQFFVPAIHCNSCIWLIEKLYRLHPGIMSSRVDFLKKTVFISFKTAAFSLRKVVELLASLGYEPKLNLGDLGNKIQVPDNSLLIKKIAVAGFCTGNIMLFSFPEYFGFDSVSNSDFRYLFGYLNLLLALPLLFFSGKEYFISAWKTVKAGTVNIDIPLAAGMVAFLGRSVYEIFTETGPGYIDSFAGLVFFLLIGKWFQTRTFDSLSFERDYKSYFPVAVTLLEGGFEKSVPAGNIKPGNRILVRNGELIPADATLLKGNAAIDYSFVTGESMPVNKEPGALIYAGGRQMGDAVELEIRKEVSQSYLTQLWNNRVFKHETNKNIVTFSEKVSKVFTYSLFGIALATFCFWSASDVSMAFSSFTAVLIIACPCALAISTPFALGNALRILGRNKFYLKNSSVVEYISKTDTLVFDKTGTITEPLNSTIVFMGEKLSELEKRMVASLVWHSNHPLSRRIYDEIQESDRLKASEFNETPGKGISGRVNEAYLKIGSARFVGFSGPDEGKIKSTSIYVSINGVVKGCFQINNKYRKGLRNVIENLETSHELFLLSGDKDSERENLGSVFLRKENLHFDQTPQGKLEFIEKLQLNGRKVMMVGDGLNDSGALKQSDAGIVLTDSITNFSPACDGILDASQFSRIPDFIGFSKLAVRVIYGSFFISLTYNLVGLSFAVRGLLSPVFAAILMPVSSVSVVLFTITATNYFAKKKGLL